MKAIKIYTTEGKYFMEDLDNGMTHELTNPKHVGRDNTDWFTLPENSCNRQCVCKQMIDRKTEITYGEKTPRTANPDKKSTKIDYTEHYTKEEAEKVKKHQDAIDKINAEVKARIEKEMAKKELLENAMKLSIEDLQAIMEKKMEAKA